MDATTLRHKIKLANDKLCKGRIYRFSGKGRPPTICCIGENTSLEILPLDFKNIDNNPLLIYMGLTSFKERLKLRNLHTAVPYPVCWSVGNLPTRKFLFKNKFYFLEEKKLPDFLATFNLID